MENKKIFFVFLIIILCVINVNNIINTSKEKDYIDTVLTQRAYSYLPTEAKEYIKEVYKKTGEVILTEKNKKENIPYLNPQYVDYITSTDEEKKEYDEIPISSIIDYTTRATSETVDIPSTYDLRNVNGNNYVTPVRDQGDLGICWTFATAGVAESHLLKKNNTTYTESSKLISERQIDYSTARNGISDYKSEYVSFVNRSLGDGGNFYISTIAMANGISLIDYKSFKEYNDKDLQKMELSDVISYKNSLYEVNSTINFPRLNLRESTSILNDKEQETRTSYLKEIKKNIINNGAAYVGTYMGSACQYKDSNLNNIIIDVYNCNISGAHAMEIIGWDDDIEYSYCADTTSHKAITSSCKRPVTGRGIWILKNSWGEQTQYPYLTYDSLYSSISFIKEMESTTNKNWDNNYVLGNDNEGIKEKTYYLSDTKIRQEEKLKKIKFIAETPDTTYNVKISKKDRSYETFSKTSELPGLITLDINKDFIVNKDTTITISSKNSHIDKVSVFTKNIDVTPYIDIEKYKNISISEDKIRLYSETKNIASGSLLTYKVYNSSNIDVSSQVTFTNNIVAENNVNTLATFSNDLESGTYRIDVIFDSNILATFNVNIIKMAGAGTKSQPYIITTPTQLSQIRNNLNAYYELGNDIDLTNDTKEGGKLSLTSNTCPQGFGWESINGFSGTLDGKGHTIKGLYQNNYITCNEEKESWREWTDNGNGLFGTVSKNVTIKNLVLENFDINCQGGYCGALVSNYNSNNNDNNDKNEYNATFENIAIKNSSIKGVYNNYNSNSSLKNTYGGGLFGNLKSMYGNINLSNIYLNIDLKLSGLSNKSLLFYSMQGKKATIKNIQLAGSLTGKYNDGSGDGILGYSLYASNPVTIKNIISTVDATNVKSSLFGDISGDQLSIDSINVLKIKDKGLCKNPNSCLKATNINLYDKNKQLLELTKKANYSSWEDFDNNWVIRTIDGIPRIPVLKFVNFEYTNIPDIIIKQELNKKTNIYDYISPNIDSAKKIIYKSNNENIATIDEFGVITPKSTGATTIHIESSYDGYIKDVPISITYTPHYNIIFDANGGTGTMNNIEVPIGENYKLPNNAYTKENYEFKEWNTKADGSGTSYSNLSQINNMKDKDSITLYAQWIGEERIVTFDANGGNVNPNKKTVHYGETYGDLPIPTKKDYAFQGWTTSNIFVDAKSKIRGYNLVASWKADSYTIIYDANEGTLKSDFTHNSETRIMSNSTAISIGTNNIEKTIIENIYERTFYKFKEWNTEPDGSGSSYNENQKVTLNNVENSTLRLYAIWEQVTGTITYVSNDGTDQTSTQIYTLNTNTKLDKNKFAKTGYIFKEWNTKSDGSGTSYIDEQTINISQNLTLYAIWQESYDYVVNTYTVDKTNNYISKIMVGTTVSDFKNNFELNNGYSINVDSKIINDQQILYTGGKTKIFKGQDSYAIFTNIVIGDLNGDGIINSADLLKVRQHLLTTKILTGAYFLSSDINYDDTINSADLLRIRQHLLGLKPIS